MLGVSYALKRDIYVQFEAGLSQWHLNSKASAYYASNGITATARKNIDTKGTDPILSICITTTKSAYNLVAHFESRSLKLKTDTYITSADVSYSFQF